MVVCPYIRILLNNKKKELTIATFQNMGDSQNHYGEQKKQAKEGELALNIL